MSFANTRNILVTSALPYANGPLHLGHLLETIQTDIWVRQQKLQGNNCMYMCADDAHGTAIMLKAEQMGITPEQLIDQVKADHLADFNDFLIGFDHYHSTHSPENQTFSAEIYNTLNANGHIASRPIKQLFDPEKSLFLADRYIKGTCPKCKATDQYGDNCEVCGATYAPADLINPVSVLSGASPVEKESEHFFFKLPEFQSMLSEWLQSDKLQTAVANKLREWVDGGLQEWDISRDAPYFGFEIPGENNKFFYVWLDAPIGYMASFKHYSNANGISFEEYWSKDSQHELYHFIGKDIINFHGLFWPAMLESAGYRKPSAVYAHGFLTVDGKKMSKSRGTFITARNYLKQLNPEYLRYYFAAKMGSGVDDIDLNLEDFISKVNSDLVGKVINIASRSAKFIHKGNNGKLSAELVDQSLWNQAVSQADEISQLFEAREYAKATKSIMAIADATNEFFDANEPWKLAKKPDTEAQAVAISSQCINLFKVIMTYLAPILPVTALASKDFLNAELIWDKELKPLSDHEIKPFKPMMTRIDPKKVTAMVDTQKAELEAAAPKLAQKTETHVIEPIADIVSFDDFVKIDLRVGEVVEASYVEGAKKLLQLTINIGIKNINIFSGIRSAYDPEKLVGRHIVVVANLASRKMKFGTSEGMALAAGPGGKDIWLLSPDNGATAGMRIL